MDTLLRYEEKLRDLMSCLASGLSLLFLRWILAYEFFQAGYEKLHGENWFADIQSQFLFPFNILPPELSWQLALWVELLIPALLVVGFATRYSALVLMVLTVVAAHAVHLPTDAHSLSEFWQGYAISDEGHGNFKLPLLYLIMLLVLVGKGAGSFSFDQWIAKKRGLI